MFAGKKHLFQQLSISPPPNIRLKMKIQDEKRIMLWYGDYRAVCGCCSAQAQRVDVVTGECRAGHAERPTNRELLHGRSRDRGEKKTEYPLVY